MQKPGRNATLNKSHPLSKDLVGCWLFNEGTGRVINDYSGNALHCVGSTDLAYQGGGLRLYGNGTTNITHASAPIFQVLGDRSIFAIANPFTARNNRLLHVTVSGETEDTNSLFLFHLTNADKLLNYCEYGAGVNVTTLSDTLPIVYGTEQSFGMSIEVNSTSNHSFYYEGYPCGVRPGKINATGGSSTQLELGTYYSGNDTLNGIMQYILYFSRLLSSDEMRYLHSCPYCMFN